MTLVGGQLLWQAEFPCGGCQGVTLLWHPPATVLRKRPSLWRPGPCKQQVQQSRTPCRSGDLWLMRQPVAQAFDDLDAPPERVTGAEVPMPYAANLEAAALPQVRWGLLPG